MKTILLIDIETTGLDPATDARMGRSETSVRRG